MKFTNRLVSLLLCILMLSAVACLAVSAKTVFPVGYWVYEKINNDTEFEVDVYNGQIANVTTPYSHNNLPITSIGSNAFDGNTALKKMTFNYTITAIQSYAYLNCENLTTVVFNNAEVDLIAMGAFSGCSSLSSINLEDTKIETVSHGTFMNCDSLTEITLPDTTTSIKENAFGYCDNLEKITIPASVTSIDENAFYNTPNVVIYCYENSYAHTFAEGMLIDYVLIEEEEPTQPTTPVETYILGDVDNDGSVNILDATEIQLVLAQLSTDEDGRKAIRGNVDKDENLSIMDATSIQWFLAGLDDSLDIEKTFEY